MLLPLLLLLGCSNAHKGEHCIASHQVVIFINQCMAWSHIRTGKYSSVSVCTFHSLIPYSSTHCDQWAPNDPSTVKPRDSWGD